MEAQTGPKECDYCSEDVLPLKPSCDNCNNRLYWEWKEDCVRCNREVDYANNRCLYCGADLHIWAGIHQAALDTESNIVVCKDSVPDPDEVNYVTHLGSPKGQQADYRLPLNDGSELHVVEFENRYEIHQDNVSAINDPVGHVITDAPAVAILALCIAGYAFSGS